MTPLGLMLLVLVSGCAPLPPPAPAVVESVKIQSFPVASAEFLFLREGICRNGWIEGERVKGLEVIPCPLEELQGYIEQTQQEIARDQAQQAEEVSPWLGTLVGWAMLIGGFVGVFLWAIRWSWKQ